MSLRRRMPGGKLPFVVLQRNTKFHSCTQTVIRSSFTTKCKILKLYPNSYSFFTTKYTILKVAPKWLFVFPTKKCENLLFIINLASLLKNRKKKNDFETSFSAFLQWNTKLGTLLNLELITFIRKKYCKNIDYIKLVTSLYNGFLKPVVYCRKSHCKKVSP